MRTKNTQFVDIFPESKSFCFSGISLAGCGLFDKWIFCHNLFRFSCYTEIFSSFAIVMYLFISHIKTQRAIFKILMYTWARPHTLAYIYTVFGWLNR